MVTQRVHAVTAALICLSTISPALRSHILLLYEPKVHFRVFRSFPLGLPGPLWAGPYGPGSYGPPWALVGWALMRIFA